MVKNLLSGADATFAYGKCIYDFYIYNYSMLVAAKT